MLVTASEEVDSVSVVMEERVDKTCLSELAEVSLLLVGTGTRFGVVPDPPCPCCCDCCCCCLEGAAAAGALGEGVVVVEADT